MEYLFIALLVLAIPVAGVAGFFMALNLRARTLALETRLATLELRFAGPPPAAEAPRRAEPPPPRRLRPWPKWPRRRS